MYTDGLVERRDEDIDAAWPRSSTPSRARPARPRSSADRLIESGGRHRRPRRRRGGPGPPAPGAQGLRRRTVPQRRAGTPRRRRGRPARPRLRLRRPVQLALHPGTHDLGVLAASELVANSLQHGTPPMRLRLRRTDRRLIVEVTDGDDHLPRRRARGPGRRVGPRHRHRRHDRLELGLAADTGRRQGRVVRVRAADRHGLSHPCSTPALASLQCYQRRDDRRGSRHPGFRLTGSAPERYEQYVARSWHRSSPPSVDGVGLNSRRHRLDLACGTGFSGPALAAARVGPTGRVHGARTRPRTCSGSPRCTARTCTPTSSSPPPPPTGSLRRRLLRRRPVPAGRASSSPRPGRRPHPGRRRVTAPAAGSRRRPGRTCPPPRTSSRSTR